MKTKVCSKCHKEKSLSQFYQRGKYFLNECIDCVKARTARQRKVDKKISTVPSEMWVMERLAKEGIPALTGKASSHQHCDIVAYGCVGIEVKSSRAYKNKGDGFMFMFTPRQVKQGPRGKLIVLVCCDDGLTTFHVFPSDHPMFFNENGKRRQSISYTPLRKTNKRTTYLTDEMMDAAEENWELVRICLSNHEASLIADGIKQKLFGRNFWGDRIASVFDLLGLKDDPPLDSIKVQGGLQGFAMQLDTLGTKVTNLGSPLLAMAAPEAVAFEVATQMAANFDEEMGKIQAATGRSDIEMEVLQTEVLNLIT